MPCSGDVSMRGGAGHVGVGGVGQQVEGVRCGATLLLVSDSTVTSLRVGEHFTLKQHAIADMCGVNSQQDIKRSDNHHLCSYTVSITHASQHLSKVVSVDGARGAGEVLSTVCWGSGKGEEVKQDLRLTSRERRRRSVGAGCCMSWQRWWSRR